MSCLRNPSFMHSCILAGLGIVFLVLVSVLPPAQVVALVGGTSVAIGSVLTRLGRGAVEGEPAARSGVEG